MLFATDGRVALMCRGRIDIASGAEMNGMFAIPCLDEVCGFAKCAHAFDMQGIFKKAVLILVVIGKSREDDARCAVGCAGLIELLKEYTDDGGDVVHILEGAVEASAGGSFVIILGAEGNIDFLCAQVVAA